MTHYRRIFGLIVALGCVSITHAVHAATLTLRAPQSVIPSDGTAVISLRLDSAGATVNAFEATLTYDPTVLELQQVTPDASFASLWIEPPHLVKPGVIAMTGGRPNGSVLLDAPLATMTFAPLHEGSASVSIVPAQSGVYLNDAQATAVPLTVTNATLALAGPLHLVSQPVSTTHPDAAAWSRFSTVIMQWSMYPTYEVSYLLSKDPAAVPSDAPAENVGSVTFPNLSDGVWYFSFKERIIGTPNWSPVMRRSLLIDATAPDPFRITSTRAYDGGAALLTFTAHDATSGIASYTVRIAERNWWMPWKDAVRTATVTNGTITLTNPSTTVWAEVTATDAAGNTRTVHWAGEHPRRTLALFVGFILLCVVLLTVIVGGISRVVRWMCRTSRKRRT